MHGDHLPPSDGANIKSRSIRRTARSGVKIAVTLSTCIIPPSLTGPAYVRITIWTRFIEHNQGRLMSDNHQSRYVGLYTRLLRVSLSFS